MVLNLQCLIEPYRVSLWFAQLRPRLRLDLQSLGLAQKGSLLLLIIQGVPELAPQRKQACADNKKDSKLTKINFLLAQITEL
jgi:hypothetical protein